MNFFKFLMSDPNIEETVSDAISDNSIVEAGANVVADMGNSAMEEITELNEEITTKVDYLQDFLKEVPSQLIKFGFKILVALLIFVIGVKVISIIRKVVKKALDKSNAEKAVEQFLDSLIKVVLYILLICMIAARFGIQTTGLAAVVGSAGVAFALALQGSLSNLTGGVLILLLKPFRIGDYIVDGSSHNEGTVIEMQLFHTKLRTVDDRIIIVPNGNLANACITNMNLSPDRRVVLTVGISYNSDIKKAKEVIRKCIDGIEWKLDDKDVDVYVDELADSAVIIGYRFFVANENFHPSRWKIQEDVKNALDKAGIEIPFNQLDVHVKSSDIQELKNIKVEKTK